MVRFSGKSPKMRKKYGLHFGAMIVFSSAENRCTETIVREHDMLMYDGSNVAARI